MALFIINACAALHLELCITVNQAACFIFPSSISFSGWRTKGGEKAQNGTNDGWQPREAAVNYESTRNP